MANASTSLGSCGNQDAFSSSGRVRHTTGRLHAGLTYAHLEAVHEGERGLMLSLMLLLSQISRRLGFELV
jgi:hypothetical protein